MIIKFFVKDDGARRAIIAGQPTDGLYPVDFTFQSTRYVGWMEESGEGVAAPNPHRWQLVVIRDQLLYKDAWAV